MKSITEINRFTQDALLPLDVERHLNALVDQVGDSKIVMLGEATHGTQEFYRWRRLITQKLLAEKNFNFIAVEGDWPEISKINRHIIKGESDAAVVMSSFNRWPTWMWANTEVLKLVEWLKNANTGKTFEQRIGFYGLDVYSMFESMDAVVAYTSKVDPLLGDRLRDRYACFEPFNRDEIAYAQALLNLPKGCEEEVAENLADILRIRLSGKADVDFELFDAKMNARIAANAEHYYRTMMSGEADSWNIRDNHMIETLEELLNKHGSESKAIVWAHNTHIGDYRATDMARQGYVNIGGLARQKYGEEQVSLVGFGTHRGTVMAASAWGGAHEVMDVPPAREGSYEHIFHRVAEHRDLNSFLLLFDRKDVNHPLHEFLGHRAIGVVYSGVYESRSQYVPSALAARYDAFIYIDSTRALSPLKVERGLRGEFPQTYPSAQ